MWGREILLECNRWVQDSSPTRKFTGSVFEDSSSTLSIVLLHYAIVMEIFFRTSRRNL